MSYPDQQLEDVFGPVRDQFLVAFVSTLRTARSASPAIDVEPIRKKTDHSIGRAGMLGLPSRDDCVMDPEFSPTTVSPPQQTPVHYREMHFDLGGRLSCEVFPFVWNDVWVSAEPSCDSALLMRVRLWFLDWFQTRLVDGVDEVMGVVHSLDGPYEFGGRHWFQLDLGTAPVDALLTLMELFGAGQVLKCQIGAVPPFAAL